ncbi:hypothetical protein [Mesorhizobium sp. B2-6-2]|uniref:hypothetical protein n=1 Tax=Mesorhizobium sp. B2-6-2 TaxID=2589915 RepID=UPI0011274441|nr:hypothetical protein [Mesorhizobium sp. B2-6-2]TPJ77643.1 hypothetical protein FJ419_14595 [Mesorhizobium sp. B2-6-2]
MLRNSVFAIVTAGLMAAGGASASEFGNIFGSSEARQASSVASAAALEGIARLIRGIQVRELRAGDGAEDFSAAANAFADAADKMDKLLEGEFPDTPLSDEQVARVKSQLVPGTESYSLVENSKSMKDLYRGFSMKTRQLAGQMDGLSKQTNAFSIIAPMLVDYFRLANAVVIAQPA